MSTLLAIIAATLAGGVLSVLLAATLDFRFNDRVSQQLVAFAVGTLLAAACLDLLPEALEAFVERGGTEDVHAAATQLFLTLLVGLLLFFSLERLALWRHAHPEQAHAHAHNPAQNAATLILVGDAFHNFVDGILIAAAFLTDPALGLASTLAIIIHELPQELGDFVVLRHAGWSKQNALLANIASSLASVLGGLIGYYFLNASETALPYALALAAASFLYIAVADLLPMLHQQSTVSFQRQALWMGCGIFLISVSGYLLSHAH